MGFFGLQIHLNAASPLSSCLPCAQVLATLSMLYYSIDPYTTILAKHIDITKAQYLEATPVYYWDEKYCNGMDLSYKYWVVYQ